MRRAGVTLILIVLSQISGERSKCGCAGVRSNEAEEGKKLAELKA